MKERIKSIISYISPAFIVLILSCLILGVQGIWPFGNETIDFYDMAQQCATDYEQMWDEIHGAKSIVLDWYTLLGRGIPGGTFFSVFNLLYYFVPRDMILESFSVMLVLKMMCMAVAMRVFIKAVAVECPDFYGIVLSAGYGLCGFVLMQYTLMNWMDIAVIVPIALMYAQRVLRDGKITGFIISMAMMLAVGFYIPVMLFIFIFLMAGVYIVSLKVSRSNQKIYLLRLGIASVFSLLLSAFAWIPKVFKSYGSARYNNEAESSLLKKYAEILEHVRPDYSTRWWAMLGISFAAAITLTGLLRDIKKKQWGRFVFVVSGCVILLAELLFENIQLMWHFGSYVNYPVRNGFLFYIHFAMAAACYIPELIGESSEKLNASREQKTGINVYVGGGFIIAILLDAAGLYWYQSNPGMSVYDVFRVTMLTCIVTFLIYFFLVSFKKGQFAKLSVFILASEIIFYGVLLIGKPTYITGYSEEPEQEGDYVRIVRELSDKMDIQSSRLDRIKNPDESLNSNYGILLKRATLSGWYQNTNYSALGAAANMGYSTQYTRLLDAGGNVFTDAILHVTQVLSHIPQDEMLYEKESEATAVTDHLSGDTENYRLYNCRYILPFGTAVSSKDRLDDIKAASGTVDFVNAVYTGISGDESAIAQWIDTDLESGCGEIYAEGKKALYFTGNCTDAEYKNLQIYVNGDLVPVPSIKENDNTWYPAHFNNNSVLLGCFEDENVNVEIIAGNNADAPEIAFSFYTIDIDLLKELCDGYVSTESESRFFAGTRSITAYVNGKNGEYLMMPLYYDDDWSATVNGRKTDITEVNGLISAVPIGDGENTVELTYFPKTMKLGIIISIGFSAVYVISAIFMMFGKKKGRYLYTKKIFRFLKFEDCTGKILSTAYMAVWSLVILGMYIVPAAYGLWFYISEVL